MTAKNDAQLFTTVIKGSLLLLLLLAVIGFLISVRHGLGVMAGGTIALINFAWMRTTLQRVLGLQPASPGRYAVIRFIGRMTVTGVLLYAALTSGPFALGGVLAGLSIIAISIIVLTIYRVVVTGG